MLEWRTVLLKQLPRLWVALVALALLFLHVVAPLDRMERGAFDFAVAHHPSSPWPEDFVAVVVDDAAIRKLSSDGQWPIRRATAAALWDRLDELGARTIAYDGMIQTRTDPVTDARVVRSLPLTLLPMLYARTPSMDSANTVRAHALRPIDVAFPRLPLESAWAPLEEFSAASRGLGHVIEKRDPDGMVRTQFPLMAIEGEKGAVPSLSLLALLLQRGVDPDSVRWSPGKLVIPGHADVPLEAGALVLELSPASELPPILNAIDLLDPSPAATERARAMVKGRLALIYIDNLNDTSPTPYSIETPGGLILAHAIRAIDAGHAPRFVARWKTLLPIVALLLLLASWLVKAGPQKTGLLTVCGMVIFASLQQRIFSRFDVFLPIIDPLLLIAASGAVLGLHGSRALDAERKRLRSLLAVARDDAKTIARGGAGADLATRGIERETLSRESRHSRNSGTEVLAGVGSNLLDPVEVGKYTVQRAIGRGGMGAIFLAVDNELQRPVALKILEQADKGAYARFRREALAVARISHPNVVQIYEVGLDAKVPFIVMEYVGGGTIADLLRDADDLPWSRSARLIAGIARGLGAAHQKGIVHRDVKPANLLLEKRTGDVAKVADFGIAKLSGGESLTKEGSFIGTIGYLSPEQAQGLDVDPRSDVYSLGLTWFRMLTGLRAFEGTTAQVLRAAVTQSVPDPRQFNPSIPDPVAELVMRMGALDRAQRPRDGMAVAALIEDHLATTIREQARVV